MLNSVKKGLKRQLSKEVAVKAMQSQQTQARESMKTPESESVGSPHASVIRKNLEKISETVLEIPGAQPSAEPPSRPEISKPA